MEPSEIRRQVLQTLDRARRGAAAHRDEVERASRAAEALLPAAAALWKQAANVLRAEGFPFQVQTPAGALRFVSDRSPDDFVEVTLDTTRRPVALLGRVGLVRGRRHLDREVVVAEGHAVETIGDRQVLEFLLDALEPFVER